MCSLSRYIFIRTSSSEDPDQTAPTKEQSDQGLHCLTGTFCRDGFERCFGHFIVKLPNKQQILC